MIQSSNRVLARIAVIGALVAALGLAGCGRKGGLDPPAATAAVSEPAPAAKPGPAIGPDGKAIAPRTGPKTPTVLDWLVD